MPLFHTSNKFFRAVAAGDTATVKEYIGHNRKWLSAVTDKKEKNTALHVAAATGQTAMVNLLLAEGAAAYNIDKNGDLPMHHAIKGNHPETVRTLTATSSPYITGYSPARRTPMQEAITANNLAVLRIFLESGKADLTADDPPSLYYAVFSAKPDCVKLLLAAGADPNVPRKIVNRSYDDDYGYHYHHSTPAKESVTRISPLQQACHVDSEEIARLLFEAGGKFLGDEFPLHTAAGNGNTGLASLLLAQKSVPVNARNAAGQTALHAAAEGKQLETVRFLLSQGADRTIADAKGRTALSCAQQFALTEMIDLLQGSSLAPALKAAAEPAPVIVSLPAPAVPLPVPPPAPPPVPPPSVIPAGDDNWALDGKTVVHIRDYAAQDRRLTTLFNFETRERVVISENLRLKTETMGPHESFDTITEEALKKAYAEYKRLGGARLETDPSQKPIGKLKAGPV